MTAMPKEMERQNREQQRWYRAKQKAKNKKKTKTKTNKKQNKQTKKTTHHIKEMNEKIKVSQKENYYLLLHSFFIAHFLILKLLKALYIKTQITKKQKAIYRINYSQINVKQYIWIWQKENQ